MPILGPKRPPHFYIYFSWNRTLKKPLKKDPKNGQKGPFWPPPNCPEVKKEAKKGVKNALFRAILGPSKGNSCGFEGSMTDNFRNFRYGSREKGHFAFKKHRKNGLFWIPNKLGVPKGPKKGPPFLYQIRLKSGLFLKTPSRAQKGPKIDKIRCQYSGLFIGSHFADSPCFVEDPLKRQKKGQFLYLFQLKSTPPNLAFIRFLDQEYPLEWTPPRFRYPFQGGVVWGILTQKTPPKKGLKSAKFQKILKNPPFWGSKYPKKYPKIY